MRVFVLMTRGNRHILGVYATLDKAEKERRKFSGVITDIERWRVEED